MARLRRLPAPMLAGVALGLVGVALGWLWFRDSSFARVERVVVTGSTSSERDHVREALAAAAAGMSTLHVDAGALRESVAAFPSVETLRIRPDFPHDLAIEVVERRPVAQVQSGITTVPVTGGGRLLSGLRAEDLPTVRINGPLTGERITDRRTLAALAVAAAAPAPLRARAERLWFGPRGMTLDLRDGPQLIFGEATDAGAKWRAAARVLAESTAGGATYLDLRIPQLVAAGGVGPVTPEPEATPAAVATPNPLQPNPQP